MEDINLKLDQNNQPVKTKSLKLLNKKQELDKDGNLVVITQKEMLNCKLTFKYIPRPCKLCNKPKGKVGGWYCGDCRLKSKYIKYKDKPKHTCTICLAPRDRSGYLCISCHNKKIEERKLRSKNLRSLLKKGLSKNETTTESTN